MSSEKLFSLFGKIALIIIVFGIVGFGAYYFGTKSIQNQKEQAPTQANQPSLTPTQETSTVTSSPTPTVDETAALIQAIKNALVAEHGSQAGGSLNVTVSKIDGNYASGTASEQGGGGMWFAAKVGGVWKLVWDGNGVILCSSLSAYPNFPSDMISECWDDKTLQSIKR